MLMQLNKPGSQDIAVNKMPFIYIMNYEAEMLKANLSNQIDGSTTVFTTPANYKANSLRVYYNGVRQESGNGYSETSSNTFTTVFIPQLNESLSIDYQEE